MISPKLVKTVEDVVPSDHLLSSIFRAVWRKPTNQICRWPRVLEDEVSFSQTETLFQEA